MFRSLRGELVGFHRSIFQECSSIDESSFAKRLVNLSPFEASPSLSFFPDQTKPFTGYKDDLYFVHVVEMGQEQILTGSSSSLAIQVAIYHTLRFADLAPLSDIQAPEFVREVHMRKIGTIAFNKLRGNKNKQNMPAIVGMYEKFLATPAGVVKRTKTGRMKKLVEKFRDSLSVGADVKFAEKPPIQAHVKSLKKIPDDTPAAIVTTGERVGLLEAAALEVEEMEQHDLELYTMDQSCIEDFADYSPSSGPALKKRHNLPRNR